MTKRSSRRRIESRILNSVTPVFALDGSRKIVMFNQGCELLTGRSADDYLGRICDYSSERDGGDATNATVQWLAAPPETFHGQQASQPVYVPKTGGSAQARLVHFYPLCAPDGDVELVLGFVAEIADATPPVPTTAAQQLHAELAALRNSLRDRYGINSVVTRNEQMSRVLQQVQLAARSDIPVLITGEPGTGKEHLARVIHQASNRRGSAFVPLECGTLPAREVRRTLRRLFVDDDDEAEAPVVARPGVSAGTVYLRDVDRLQRDVQEMIVEEFAGQSNVVPARLLAGTTVNLQQEMENDAIRSDFYYLLTSLQIEVPPLRTRCEEIELLAQSFLEEGNRVSDHQLTGFTSAVLEQFRTYRWPANLAELKQVVAECREVCDGVEVDTQHLPFRFRTGMDAQSVGPPVQRITQSLDAHLAKIETEMILAALEEAGQNKTKAAEALGLTRPKLYRRMETLGIAEEKDDVDS